MKHTFKYGELSYEYYIEFANRKTFALVVRPDLRIIVKAPIDATLDSIELFLKRKWKWLDRQLRELEKYHKKHYEKKYLTGETFQYLGRTYQLHVERGNDYVKLTRGKLHVFSSKSANNIDHTKTLVETWYDNRRSMIFKRQYIMAFKRFDYEKMPQMRIRAMSRRWGSYTSDGKVSLNPKLIEAPIEAINYVCVHELCHVSNKKHDRDFYDKLKKHMPEWKKIKERLEIRYG